MSRILGIILIPIVFIGGVCVFIFDKKSTSWDEIKEAVKTFYHGKQGRVF